uniref:hypothetical protein n=1 Tax=Drechslerella dactyloides TaxID=74499 RepID=UPI0022FD9395
RIYLKRKMYLIYYFNIFINWNLQIYSYILQTLYLLKELFYRSSGHITQILTLNKITPTKPHAFVSFHSNSGILPTPQKGQAPQNKKPEDLEENSSVELLSKAVKVYIDLMEPSTLVKIREDLKSVSGVYAFKSNMSNKVYVGSSINLAGRAMDHIKNQNSNIYLQNAITKYGLNKFSFFVLEFLPQDCTSYDDLLDLEQKYLNLFKDKYNFENFAKKI